LEKLKKHPGGVSSAIRERLDRTFVEESFDQQSRELADSVLWISDELSHQIGAPWHTTRKGHQALTAAIEKLLSEEPLKQQDDAAEDAFGPDDPPTLGRTIARQFLRLRGAIVMHDLSSITWGRIRSRETLKCGE
jgi:hypothetical protein